MDLAALLSRRAVPGAGLLLSLTSRCPLSCRHCSTSSAITGPQPAATDLRRFIAGFTVQNRPDVVFFTGGEPLLRPGLLAQLAAMAASAGTASAVLTGAFFAVGGRIPDRIRAALLAVDHVSISLDAFHEREVPRAAVFALLRELLRLERPVSLHVLGTGAGDPYLADVTGQVRQQFGTAVPMLVSAVQPVGRAAAWATARVLAERSGEPSPCGLAGWPVLAPDGAVIACCAPAAVDRRPVPEHLLLGDVTRDDWATVRQRLLGSPMLRAVRVLGPDQTWSRFGPADGERPAGDVCRTCHALPEQAERVGAVAAALSGPGGELLDRVAADRQLRAGPVALLRRYAVAPYADLLTPEVLSPEVPAPDRLAPDPEGRG
jgi:hypothetical protein